MKIALLLTGFPRTYGRTYRNLKKNILDVHDVDTYICSWDRCQLRSGEATVSVDKESVLNLHKENLQNAEFLDYEKYVENRFQNIKFLDRSNDVFKTDPRAIEHGSYWVERLRDQWYIVQHALSMVYRSERYDLIMRLRFDIDLFNIDIKNKEFVIPKDIGGWNYSDHFAYGTYDSMQKYCNMFNAFHDMYLIHNIDISHATNMLKFYMEKYKSPVNTYIDSSIQYTIIK